MKFGVLYAFRNPPRWHQPYPDFYRAQFEQMQAVEQLGYDVVWVTEHHFIEDGYLPSLLPVAAVIGDRTKRVQIGTYVLLLPLHHPLRVAEDAAVVDVISNGRLILGLGQGYRLEEFEGFNINPDHRPRMTEEGIEVIQGAWTQDNFSYAGEHYQVKNITLTPKPVQKPHPPLGIGARGLKPTRRAAKYGCHLMGGALGQYDIYVNALKEYGRDPKDFDVMNLRPIYVHRDPERAWEEAGEHIFYLFQNYGKWFGTAADLKSDTRLGAMNVASLAEIRDTDFWRNIVIAGSPEQVTERLLKEHASAPCDHLLFFVLPGLAYEKMLGSIRLFAEEVMPHLRPLRTPAKAG
jgi:alkanesulfonate monooxygenase SsuD/methylene tetrahydromethanopterin reductase-like flavin-dependent oxidoreductase (luciferase family)